MKLKKLVCKWCGKGFRGKEGRKYCSKSCSAKGSYEERNYDKDKNEKD